MTLHNFLSLIARKKQTFISVFVIFFLIAGCITVIQPFKYGSNSKLLTVHTYKEAVDPYVAARSNDYLSVLFTRIVYSNSFFDKVMDSDFNIDKSYFKGSERKQMKTWSKTVKARSVADTGIIELDIYHSERNQAEQISRAITFVLQTNHQLYHGFGDNVQIKEIDTPITSTYPVKPDVLLNFGLVVGFTFVFSFFYIYILPEERYDIRLWPRAKKKGVIKESDNNWSSVADVLKENKSNYEAGRAEEVYEYPQESELTGEQVDYHDGGDMNNILK